MVLLDVLLLACFFLCVMCVCALCVVFGRFFPLLACVCVKVRVLMGYFVFLSFFPFWRVAEKVVLSCNACVQCVSGFFFFCIFYCSFDRCFSVFL